MDMILDLLFYSDAEFGTALILSKIPAFGTGIGAYKKSFPRFPDPHHHHDNNNFGRVDPVGLLPSSGLGFLTDKLIQVVQVHEQTVTCSMSLSTRMTLMSEVERILKSPGFCPNDFSRKNQLHMLLIERWSVIVTFDETHREGAALKPIPD